MEPGDMATWAGAAAAAVAAVASTAMWVGTRGAVRWEYRASSSSRSRVVNTGHAVARDVHVRVGSAADERDVDAQERAAKVQHGEAVVIDVQPTFSSPKDYAVVVTWRGRRNRRERWEYWVL